MTPLYTIAEIRAVEQAAFKRMPSYALMEMAGASVADCAHEMLGVENATVLAVAGGGNNGGDAFVAADCLRRHGVQVEVALVGEPAALPADAKRAYQAWSQGGGEVRAFDEIDWREVGVVIDGLLGIGLSRPVTGDLKRVIEAINERGLPVVAVDAPSGLAAESGEIMAAAVRATKTVTFFAGKPGLYTGTGVDVSGEVIIASLGIDCQPTAGVLLDELPQPARLQRRRDSHKGTYGHAVLIGGDSGMVGALILAARAAVALGAGKTTAMALAADAPAVDWLRPDILWHRRDIDAACRQATVLAAGMGMGLTETAAAMLEALLAADKPLLLDADALTMMAESASLRQKICCRSAPTVLTPHPTEAGRLLGAEAAEVNRDRLAAARELAEGWAATVVLKGAGSIVYSPAGDYAVCAAGNPGLARGGSGDVLAGMITALFAQTGDADYAARAGVWLHAAAADMQAKSRGVIGVDVNMLAQTAAGMVG